MTRILLIEDDFVLRQTLALQLRRAQYDVLEATHGAEALQQLHAQPVDLVVTDMVMPEMEGVETIRALRHHFPAVKIIAISGGGTGDANCYLKIARELGAHKTLEKPFSLQVLLDAVNELLHPQ